MLVAALVWGSLPTSAAEFEDLSGNLLHGELPECLKVLSKLRVLDLSYNAFTGKIPPSWKWRPTHLDFKDDEQMVHCVM